MNQEHDWSLKHLLTGNDNEQGCQCCQSDPSCEGDEGSSPAIGVDKLRGDTCSFLKLGHLLGNCSRGHAAVKHCLRILHRNRFLSQAYQHAGQRSPISLKAADCHQGRVSQDQQLYDWETSANQSLFCETKQKHSISNHSTALLDFFFCAKWWSGILCPLLTPIFGGRRLCHLIFGHISQHCLSGQVKRLSSASLAEM